MKRSLVRHIQKAREGISATNIRTVMLPRYALLLLAQAECEADEAAADNLTLSAIAHLIEYIEREEGTPIALLRQPGWGE